MATKKKVVKKAPAKAVKKEYAWAWDDGDVMLGKSRFDSVEEAMQDIKQAADFNAEDDDIILVEIVKKFRVTLEAKLVEVK